MQCLFKVPLKFLVTKRETSVSAFLYATTIYQKELSGGAANFGFISITYHQYIFSLYKYILRLEISIFDRENNKKPPRVKNYYML